jgi:hypothetical protein
MGKSKKDKKSVKKDKKGKKDKSSRSKDFNPLLQAFASRLSDQTSSFKVSAK